MTTVDGLRLRLVMGKREWRPPTPYGPDGWQLDTYEGHSRILVTTSPILRDAADQTEWTHASVSHPDRIPSYDDITRLHRAVWGDNGWAYQVFAPSTSHVNIHEYALHLWGRADGAAVLPDFGSILYDRTGGMVGRTI